MSQYHKLYTPQDSAIVFIDHQPQMLFGVASIERSTLINNVSLLAKIAKEFKVPAVLTAVATFLGVFPVAIVLNLTLGPAIKPWHFLLSNAVFNACMVGLLTWVIMPGVTRILHSWLYAETKPKPERIET